MADDERVKAVLVHQLEPCHVKLCRRRAAPLARFEQHQAYRLARQPHRFQPLDEFALWPVELEMHIFTAAFRLDEHIDRRPEWEVVAATHPDELQDHRFNGFLRAVAVHFLLEELLHRPAPDELLYQRDVHHLLR